MSLLKTFIKEMAAGGSTGAGAIAVSFESPRRKEEEEESTLNSGGIIDGDKVKRKQHKMLRRVMSIPTPTKKKRFLESLGVDSGKSDFDASDVLSKIDSAQKQERLNDDTTAFGLEDDEGNLIKVYVKTDQAEEFENTLSSMLAGQIEGDDNEDVSAKEIAEVLYELKDKFDIVDVQWPGIEADEEEEQEVTDPAGDGVGAAGADMAAGGAAGGDMAGGEGGDLGLDAPEGEGDEGLGDEEGDMEADDDAKSALQSVIDVMKADAEAKLADAEARTAEARAKEAEYSSQSAGAKVRREEQVFDMEAAEKDEKERKKEGEQQAKLARFQHQKAQGAEAQLSMESVEKEDKAPDAEITLTELTDLILKNLRHQG